jgi:hypothetical protein
MPSGQLRYIKSLQHFDRRKEDVIDYIPGILGFYLNGSQVVECPDKPGYVYVRLRDNLSETIKAYNDSVSLVFGLPVLIVRDKRDPTRYKVAGRDLIRYADWGATSYVPKHGNQHSFNPDSGGGGDIVWVYGQQFMPLLVTPSGSAGSPNCVVYGYYGWNYDDTWHCFSTTGTANLLAYKPTGTSSARSVLIYLDQSTGGLGYLGSNEYASTITGACAVICGLPDLTEDYHIPLAAVRLVTGTSSILWNNIYDVRPFYTGQGSGGGTATGSSVVWDGSFWTPKAAPDSLSAYDDEFDDESLDGKWTEWDEEGMLTVSEEEWGLQFLLDISTPNRAAGIFQTAPEGNYTIWTEAGIHSDWAYDFAADDYLNVGILFGEDLTNNPDTSAWAIGGFRIGRDNSAHPVIDVFGGNGVDYTGLIATNTMSLNIPTANIWPILNKFFLRVRFNSVESEGEWSGYIDLSLDGLNWLIFYAVNMEFLPAEIGLVCFNEAATSLNENPKFHFSHFRITTNITMNQDPLGNRIQYELK